MGAILHLSDIHFGCENKDAVRAAAECAASGDFQLIAISGDITQFGHTDEFEAAKAWVETLPKPVMITPGNHDTPYAGLIDRAVSPFARYEKYFGPAWRGAYDAGDLAARAFNSSRGMQVRLNWSKGAVDLSHVRAAVQGLDEMPQEALRVAVCHHPLMEVVGGPMTGRVRNGRGASDILAHAGIDVVLSGHVHTAFVITLPCADGMTHGVGASTLSQRERGQPPGFNIVEWDRRTLTVRAQAWTGSHFENFRTWALPRRRRSPPGPSSS
jgi:3',5'-cyclic AMP phosphodiesterase CpdA